MKLTFTPAERRAVEAALSTMMDNNRDFAAIQRRDHNTLGAERSTERADAAQSALTKILEACK